MSAVVIDLAGYRAIRRLRENFTLYPESRRGEAWRATRRCAICRKLGHDRSTCELAEAARIRAKELGVNFGEALALLKSEADHG